MTDCKMYLKFMSEVDAMYIPHTLKVCPQVMKIIDGDTEVGIMCVNNGYVDCLYILPEYRRKGYGKNAVLTYIRQFGMLTDLHVLKFNPVGQSFWDDIFELEPAGDTYLSNYYKIKALSEKYKGVSDECSCRLVESNNH